uniref:Uncharacterized protein n=1 Tax=viral metagenome TaxID=1070528 RepID=A0A6C0CDB6_9ZZZZ
MSKMYKSGNLTVMSDELDDESDNIIRKIVSAKKQFNEDVRTTVETEFTNWSKVVVPENSNNLVQSYQNFPSLK